MIRGFFYKFNRSFKNLKIVIFHVKLLSPTLSKSILVIARVYWELQTAWAIEGSTLNSTEILKSSILETKFGRKYLKTCATKYAP